MPKTMEIFRGPNRFYYFRLKARNGEILAHSEAFESLAEIRALVQPYFQGWHTVELTPEEVEQ